MNFLKNYDKCIGVCNSELTYKNIGLLEDERTKEVFLKGFTLS